MMNASGAPGSGDCFVRALDRSAKLKPRLIQAHHPRDGITQRDWPGSADISQANFMARAGA